MLKILTQIEKLKLNEFFCETSLPMTFRTQYILGPGKYYFYSNCSNVKSNSLP